MSQSQPHTPRLGLRRRVPRWIGALVAIAAPSCVLPEATMLDGGAGATSSTGGGEGGQTSVTTSTSSGTGGSGPWVYITSAFGHSDGTPALLTVDPGATPSAPMDGDLVIAACAFALGSNLQISPDMQEIAGPVDAPSYHVQAFWGTYQSGAAAVSFQFSGATPEADCVVHVYRGGLVDMTGVSSTFAMGDSITCGPLNPSADELAFFFLTSQGDIPQTPTSPFSRRQHSTGHGIMSGDAVDTTTGTSFEMTGLGQNDVACLMLGFAR